MAEQDYREKIKKVARSLREQQRTRGEVGTLESQEVNGRA